MSPTRQTLANEGRVCLTNPEHGHSLVMASGREWCAHQTHDGNREQERKPTTPWLDKQKEADNGK